MGLMTWPWPDRTERGGEILDGPGGMTDGERVGGRAMLPDAVAECLRDTVAIGGLGHEPTEESCQEIAASALGKFRIA